MIPEELVPTLETCKRLKEAGFPQEGTHFKHGTTKTMQYDGRIFIGYAMVAVVEERPDKVVAAAPTLQELLEELLKGDMTGIIWMSILLHPNPAEAAALLWLKMQKEKAQ
jgi:hypothetical protein